jgi:excisionase family DNA binding protein
MQGQLTEPILLRIEDAAGLLSVSRTTLYQLLSQGELKTIHIGRAVRVPRAELERWLARHTEGDDKPEPA